VEVQDNGQSMRRVTGEWVRRGKAAEVKCGKCGTGGRKRGRSETKRGCRVPGDVCRWKDALHDSPMLVKWSGFVVACGM
jgi:hypothetical protein